MYITEPIPSSKRGRASGNSHDRLVFGLDWRAYDRKNAKEERRRYSRELFATHYTEIRVGRETLCGLCTPESNQDSNAKLKFGTRLYAAGARIASLPRIRSEPAVLVLIHYDGHVLLVWVVRGAVRADEVLTMEAAHARRQEIETRCEKSGWHLTTLAYGDGAPFGQVDGPFQLEELLTERKIGRIQRLPFVVPSMVKVLVGAAAGIYAIHFVIEWVTPPPPPPKPPHTYQDDYNTALNKIFRVTPPPLASALAPALLDRIGQTETNVAGWQFRKATCDALGACTVTWTRKGGTFADFDSRARSAWRPIDFAADGLTLATHVPALAASPAKTGHVQQKDLAQWPTWEAMKNTLQTPAQRLSKEPERLDSFGYKVALTEPVELVGHPPPKAEAQTPATRIKEGAWTIDGFRWQAKLLQQLPSNMALGSLVIELNDTGVHFTAKGKFYVTQ